MSVINQMLKELDQRNAGNHAAANSESGSRPPMSYAIPEETNHFKKIVAAVAIILILVSVYYFKFMDRSIISEREKQATEQSTQPIVTEPVNVQPAEQKVVFEQAIIDEKSVDEKSVDDTSVEEKIVETEIETPSLNEEQPRVVKSKRHPDLKTQAERLYKKVNDFETL